MQRTLDTSEQELEALFGTARQFPLLDSEQEKETDREKWDAVDELLAMLAHDANRRQWLAGFCAAMQDSAPDIGRFANREQYFLLRRELQELGKKGTLSTALAALAESLRKRRAPSTIFRDLRSLALPATLVIAMVEVAGGPTESRHSAVAGAIRSWMRDWPDSARVAAAPFGHREHRRARLLIQRYERARDKLILHNLRLVFTIAGKYRGRNVPFPDLVQDGILGLMRAAEKYDYRKGFRFSTYCFNWINQAIRRSVGESGALIRYPNHVQEQVSRLYRLRLEQESLSPRRRSDQALAQAAGLSLDKTREILQLRNLGTSLHAPLFEDGDLQLVDTLAGDAFGSTEEAAEKASLKRCLERQMRSLDPTERRVVSGRWGLDEQQPRSRAELAEELAVSREWVRQLEQSALEKLARNPRVRSLFNDYRENA